VIVIPGGWPSALLTIAFGALAGGVTNRIAIVMLFHPYRAPRLFGRRLRWLQGAMPKNQARLARSIGRTVGTRLLTPEDVAAELADPRLRAAFEKRLGGLVEELLAGEQPSLSELVPGEVLPEIRRLLETFLKEIERRALQALESESFADHAAAFLATLAAGLEEEMVADSLDELRLGRLRERAAAWLTQLLDSDAFAATLRGHLQRASQAVLRPGRSFQELIPAGLVEGVEHAINDYLPIAMERLGRLLEDPRARAGVERAIHDLLDRFMNDLRFHQRVVAKLIVTEDTVNRVVDTLEAEGAARLGDLLHEEEVQDALARSVNEAIVEFLRRPTDRVFGRPDDPQVGAAIDAITDWVVRTGQDPAIQAFLLDRMEDVAWRIGERSWADIVRLVPGERVGVWTAAAMRSERGALLVDQLRSWITDRLLSRPIGSLGAFARDDAGSRLSAALAGPAWEWVTGKIPEVAANVRIAERVEQKVAEFPIPDLEKLVRKVTQRELDLIVRLGYLLGAVIGGALVALRALTG